MKKITVFILLAAMLLCGCGKKEEPDLGVWEMPKVDAAPTAQPKDVPSWGGGSAEKYVWNEATGINMADPGVNRYIEPTNMSHAETLALFGGQFMPMTIFNESYGSYERMYLEQVRHDVLLDYDGSLAENSYIEYRYLNKAWVEAASITIYAELCSPDRAKEIYTSRQYPHMYYAEGEKPQMSSYYLQNFVLSKIGDTRYAQWLVLPSSYFSFVEKARAMDEEKGTETPIPRLPLLTFTCREKVSDEQFIAAVCAISQASAKTIILPDLNAQKLPGLGEKGAA